MQETATENAPETIVVLVTPAQMLASASGRVMYWPSGAVKLNATDVGSQGSSGAKEKGRASMAIIGRKKPMQGKARGRRKSVERLELR